ncbi:MAG: glycosyltransferase [Lachnospiraceae bacterium]|nr:glycosyltransferase [Lachnospiraceae bacterium]
MNNSKFPPLVKSNIKLTIGMLVSNHKQYIRNCMEAIKPLLEKPWCELVAVDTVGPENTDGSIEIVKEYTDKVFRFEWCDDFSAARNCILDHAKGEWFLYFDDDEWFDSVDEFINFFETKEYEEYFSGIYYTRDYLPDGSYSMGVAGRMIRRTVNTRFIGRIHEGFNEVYAPNKLFNAFTHHYGYKFVDEEAKKKHTERNVRLIKQEIEEKGLTAKIAAQLVQEYMGSEETQEEGVKFAKEALVKLKEVPAEEMSSIQWLLVTLVRYYACRDLYEEAKEQVKKITENYITKEITRLCMAEIIAEMAIKRRDMDTFFENLMIYIENYDWIKNHQEEAILQLQMDFPRFCTEEVYLNLLWYGAAFANKLGEYQVANTFWKRFPFDREGFDGKKYVADMKETIDGLSKKKNT